MKGKKKELMPVAVNSQPAVELKFMPLVTLSYESTLELQPIPATVRAVNAGRAKRSAAASVKVRSPKARTNKARAKRARAKKGA